tara:strand:- start:463 stop:1155 length:693 start_codon:yes stop_codon:yes gene_type:complete
MFNIKKLAVVALLTLIFSVAGNLYYMKFKKYSNHVHNITFVAGSSLTGANMFFVNNTDYKLSYFFDFHQINSSVLRLYKSQKMCKGIFSDRIFKLPITIVPEFSEFFQRVTYEVTSANEKIGQNCIDDIIDYIALQEKQARLILNEIKNFDLSFYTADGNINYDLSDKIMSIIDTVTFYKIVDQGKRMVQPNVTSINFSVIIISLFISILLSYFRNIFFILKSLFSEIKK